MAITIPDRSRATARVQIGNVMDGFIFLGLLPSWLGLLGSWHWSLDLCSHFYWQYFFASLFACAWMFRKKRRLPLALSLATLLLNASLIAWWAVPRVFATGTELGPRIKVVSCNVLTSNKQHAKTLQSLRAADADVIFLMEVDREWARHLETLRDVYPHSLVHPQADNFGVALFSKLPLESLKLVFLGPAELPSIEARLVREGQPITLLGTHTLPPMGKVYAAFRDEQLIAIRRHVVHLATPTLVFGDFNATPWSYGMRLLRQDGTLDFRSVQSPLRPTWQVLSPPGHSY